MPRIAIITGASSGLGKEIANHLRFHYASVIDWSLEKGVDVREERSVELAVARLKLRLADLGEEWTLDTVVNCAGVNSIEFIPKTEVNDWDRLMNTNARGIFLVAKHTADLLRGGTILNIVSNASHVPMTSSIAYNASKGAAAIMTAQMSRELIKTHGITVFAISPNKLRGTRMSEEIDKRVQTLRGWTEEQARTYQLAALPAGEETDPETLAEFIAFLLSSKARHKFLAGCDIPYGL